MLKLGFSEALLLFSAVALWHSQVFAIIAFCLACFVALAKFSLDWSQRVKETEARVDAAKVLNEQLQEAGDVIGTLFGKKKSTMH